MAAGPSALTLIYPARGDTPSLPCVEASWVVLDLVERRSLASPLSIVAITSSTEGPGPAGAMGAGTPYQRMRTGGSEYLPVPIHSSGEAACTCLC